MSKEPASKKLVVAAAALALIAPGWAMAEDDGRIEEVVVTARMIEESLQEVPMSVSAVDGELVSELGIENVNDLFSRVPGLYFTALGGAFSNSDFQYLQIRGVGFNGGLEPAVGVFVDGMYVPQLGFDLGFLDVERIEILRGPQGTLFGRNTQAGAMNIVSRQPGDELRRRVEAEIAEFGTWRLRGALSGPLGENFYGNINLQYSETDGFVDNDITGQDFGFSEQLTARVNLRYEPSDELSFMFIADASNRDFFDIGNSVKLVRSGQDYDSLMDQDTDDEKDTWGAQFRVQWDFSDSMRLTSLTGFRTAESAISTDPDFDISDRTSTTFGPVTQSTSTPTVPIGVAPNAITLSGTTHLTGIDQEFFSQEFQLSGSTDALEWLLGLYYFDQSIGQTRAFDIGPGIPFFPLYIREDFSEDRDGYAAFGQLVYSFAEDWEFTFGARYSDEDVEKGGQRVLNIFDAVIFAFEVPGKSSDDNVSIMSSIAYQASDNVNLYLTVAEGWKAGGINRFPSRDNAVLPYDSEESVNYEFGLKSLLFGDRVTLNAAVYYIDIEGQQVLTVVPDPGGATPVTIIDNAANSTSRGLEVELNASLTDQLRLGLSYSYADTEFDDYWLNDGAGVPMVDRSGEAFDFVPEVMVSVTLGYSVSDVLADYDLDLSLNFRKVDGYTLPDGSFIDTPLGASLELPSYDNLDLRAILRNDEWRFIFYGKNLRDRFNYNDLARSAFTSITADQLYVTPMTPRQFGITVAREF
ncbi:MAG: TonB-dependent receptor [Gammaproteobacteria bacterium]|nr:TonB-dependent receptor [Gammaproteobacteria bacterium]